LTRPLQLDSFDDLQDADTRREMSATELEETRLQAYENGYAAGWEDAINAQEEEIARLRSDLGQNLRDMALTYEDARTHVLQSLQPLLTEMVSKVLPQMAQEALGHIVLESLQPEARTLADAPIRLRAHPDNRAVIEEIVLAQVGFPVAFEAEPSLSRGQVHLIAGPRETRIDLDNVIKRIAGAVRSFFHPEMTEETTHG
jgi:flagellar assembly protein FliH